MIEQLDKDVLSKSNNFKNDELEIDLKEVLCKIVSIRKALYRAAGVGVIIGIIVALSMPKQYSVKVTLSPEMGSSKSGNGLSGIAASFLGSGAAIGDASDALNASISSDIVSSTPFLLELLNIKVPISNSDEEITLSLYLEELSSPWWNYVIGFPGMMISGMKSLFNNKEKNSIVDKKEQSVIELTKEENNKIGILKKNIVVLIDKNTAITNISVTLQDPKVTAVLADSVICKLQEYIINYRTFKAKENCIYLERLFKERQQEYYVAQKKYANYIDTHDDLVLHSVRAEQDRLQNEMNLAFQVYSQLANQLEIARAKVQEEKPVFAIVEPAVVPLQTSGLGLKVYMLLCVLLSMSCTACWMLLGKKVFNRLRKV